MATLEPVDFNPFEDQPTENVGSTQLEPVDFNPFEQEEPKGRFDKEVKAATESVTGAIEEFGASDRGQGLTGVIAADMDSPVKLANEAPALLFGQIAGEAVHSLFDSVGEAVPDIVKEKFVNTLKTLSSESGYSFVDQNNPFLLAAEAIKAGGKLWESVKKEYPVEALKVESAANLYIAADLIKTAPAVAEAVSGAGKLAVDTAVGTKNTFADMMRMSSRTARDLEMKFAEVTSPSKIKEVFQSTTADANKYANGNAKALLEKQRAGVEVIQKHKEKYVFEGQPGEAPIVGEVPKTAMQQGEAHTIAKRETYKRMAEIYKEAGAGGGTISNADLIKLLEGEKIKFKSHPQTRDIIDRRITELSKEMDDFAPKTIEEVQMHIEGLNGDLLKQMSEKAPPKRGQYYVDALEKKFWDDAVESKINSITPEMGTELNLLKKDYVALKSIENGVQKSLFKQLGLDEKSKIFKEYGTSMADAHLLTSMATGSKTQFILGAAQKLQDVVGKSPNSRIKDLYKGVDDVAQRQKNVGGRLAPQGGVVNGLMDLSDRLGTQGSWLKDRIRPLLRRGISAEEKAVGLDSLASELREVLLLPAPAPRINKRLGLPKTPDKKGKTIQLGQDKTIELGHGPKSEGFRPINKAMSEESLKTIEDVLRIAQTPEGKRLLIERLAREEAASKGFGTSLRESPPPAGQSRASLENLADELATQEMTTASFGKNKFNKSKPAEPPKPVKKESNLQRLKKQQLKKKQRRR